MNTSHTFLKKAMTNSDHRTYKNTAYIRINMLYFYILYKRGHYYIIETLYSHFSWAMTITILYEYKYYRCTPVAFTAPQRASRTSQSMQALPYLCGHQKPLRALLGRSRACRYITTHKTLL